MILFLCQEVKDMNNSVLNAIEIGLRVKEMRKDQNLTQTELGKKVAVGLSTIANIESGRNKEIEQKKPLFILMAKTFGYSIDWLLYGIGNKILDGDTELINTISDEMNLSPKAKKMLECFLSLEQDKQDALYDFIKSLSNDLK